MAYKKNYDKSILREIARGNYTRAATSEDVLDEKRKLREWGIQESAKAWVDSRSNPTVQDVVNDKKINKDVKNYILEKGFGVSPVEAMGGIPSVNMAAERVNRSEKEKKKDSVAKWGGKNSMRGLAEFNKGWSSTLDLIVPDFIFNNGLYHIKDPVKAMANKYRDEYNNWNKMATESSQARGKGWEVAGDVLSGTVAAAPDAILAVMTAGASEGASLASGAAKTAGGLKGVAATAKSSAQQMMKNPGFWTSFMREAGNDYEDAKNKGANEFQATMYGMTAGLINAGVEIGGGIQALPKNMDSAKGAKQIAWNWVKSNLDEGKEEIIQGTVSNALAKLMYKPDMKVFSTSSDEDALFNPIQSVKEGAMGFAVGGILGGAQIGAGHVANAIAKPVNTANTGKTLRNIGTAADTELANVDYGRALIDEGLQMPTDSNAYKLAQKLDKKKRLSNYDIGLLYKYNVESGAEADFGGNAETEHLGQTDESVPANEASTNGATTPINAMVEKRPNVDNVQPTDDVNTIPDTAMTAQELRGMESTLAQRGATGTDAAWIANSLRKISETVPTDIKRVASQTERASINAAARLRNAGSNNVSRENIYSIMKINAQLLHSNTPAITRDVIRSYADVYSDVLEQNNSPVYI